VSALFASSFYAVPLSAGNEKLVRATPVPTKGRARFSRFDTSLCKDAATPCEVDYHPVNAVIKRFRGISEGEYQFAQTDAGDGKMFAVYGK